MKYTSTVDDAIKHSAAHILATAVLRIYPETKIGIGPVTKSGFYYDFDFDRKISDSDIKKFQDEVNSVIQDNMSITQKILPKEEAVNLLIQLGQIYKVEILHAIEDQEISLFSIGEEFIDICRGPHVKTTNQVGPILLTKVEETNWNEDVRRPKMYRIHGIVFHSIEEMIMYNEKVETKRNFEFINLLKSESLNYLVDQNEKIACYNQENSKALNQIDEVIDGMLFDYDSNILQLQNSYLNLSRIEEDLRYLFKSNLISHSKLPRSLYIKTFINESNLGSEEENLSKNINISLNYHLINGDSIDFDEIIDKIKRDMEIFGIKNDLSFEIISDDLGNPILIQFSTLLQKKYISHIKIIDPKIKMLRIRLMVSNSIDEKWCLLMMDIENSDIFKIGTKENTILSPISIKTMMSRDIIFRYIKTNPKKDPKQTLFFTKVICIPIKSKYNEFAKKTELFINNNNIFAESDISSRSLGRKIFSHLKKNRNIFVFIGEKEVSSNSVSLRFENQNLGLVAIDDLIENLNIYISKS